MSKEKYLRTDDLTEAIKSLEMVGKLLPDLLHDVYIWKWVIHALHSSFQGFMVAALKGSSGLAVLTKKSEEEWHKAHRAGSRTIPRQKLDSFLNLYKKIKTEKMLMYPRSKKFVSTEGQDLNVQKLNSLRNDFIHFRPMILLIHKEGLPGIIKECLSVIKFLALDSGNVRFRNEYSVRKIKGLIKQIDATMDELAVQYSPDA